MNNLYPRILFLLFLQHFSYFANAQPEPLKLNQAPLPEVAELSENQQRILLTDLCSKAFLLRSQLEERLKVIETVRTEVEKNRDAARADSTTTPDAIKDIQREYKMAQKEARNAEKQFNRINKIYRKGIGALDGDSAQVVAYIPKMHEGISACIETLHKHEEAEKEMYDEIKEDNTKENQGEIKEEQNEQPTAQNTQKKPEDFRQYNPKDDVMYVPPTSPCRTAREEKDPFTGSMYKELEKTELFRFTNKVLKESLGDKPHILCEAALAKSGEAYQLNLYFTIHDPRARRQFGSLKREALIALLFIDGSTENFLNLEEDEGTAEKDNQTYYFKAQLKLDKSQVRKLQTTEIDRVRVSWSAGYEDYEIYRVGALLQQGKCIEQ